jgi:glycosyltransferase involved in cell wall biosynthesis
MALSHVIESGFSEKRIKQNLEAIKSLDYDAIIRRYFLPLFRELTASPDFATSSSYSEPLFCGQTSLNHNELEGAVVERVKLSRYGNRTLKILFVCDSLAGGKGGAERVAIEVANAMSERGHQIYMAYSNTGRPAYQAANGIVLLPYTSLKTLGSKVLEVDPDVFFVFYFNRSLIKFYSLIHDTNIPFCMQECTNPNRLLINNWRLGAEIGAEMANWEREIIGSAAAKIRLTMPDYISSFPDYVRPSVLAFPNPAFPQQRIATPADDLAVRKIILNIGGMKKNKNLIALLHAFARIAPTFPDWDIKVLGKVAEKRDVHQQEILDFIRSNNGLGDRVKICGPVEEIFSEYAAAHIHIISSFG